MSIPSDLRKLYPFESHYLDIDGLRYHYVDEGEGPVILMLHGNPTWSFYYRDLIKAFSNTHRVIVPDHMGCGLSAKPQDYDYCLANHVANARKLVEHLRIDSFSMFVHDWGGPIGLGLTVDMADKLERMVVFNTTCEVDGKYPWQIRFCRIPFLGKYATRQHNAFARMAAFWGTTRKKLSPEVRKGLLFPYDSYENRIATHRFVMDIPYEQNHPTLKVGKEIAGKFDRLKGKPILLCWGMKDICFTPRFLDGWIKRFPDAEVVQFADAGHYVVEDATEEIIEVARPFVMRDTAPVGE